MNQNRTTDASERPLDLIVSPLPCPFCGAAPEQYTVGARLQFGEKGQQMVRCKSGGCVVYAVDDGSKIHHRPENGAVKLAEKLLKTIKEQKAYNA
jgi:hypothetical protein